MVILPIQINDRLRDEGWKLRKVAVDTHLLSYKCFFFFFNRIDVSKYYFANLRSVRSLLYKTEALPPPQRDQSSGGPPGPF